MDRFQINQYLIERFPEAIIAETTAYGETTIDVKQEWIKEILHSLKTAPEPGYEVLIDLTATDYLYPAWRTKVIYFLYNPTSFQKLQIAIYVERMATILSVTDLWPGANWYERELFDLFGLHFEGHPDPKRILMPDDWQGHPLLRDYALTEEPVEFKHGRLPKVPSEIIPNSDRGRHGKNLG